MMTRRKRRTFTREFKVEAVRLAKSSGQALAKLERDLDLSEGVLGRWMREAEVVGEQAFRNPSQGEADKVKIRELERQLATVAEERDILKKAVAIFSQPKG
jgi:transposase